MNTLLNVTPDLASLTDADTVAAIRRGERERYRELVERHSDKVFAVAWCRLGDRDLAEEVAQEAFIKGYRRLALLGNAERFGAWITAIARNLAINLGLRRRSELRKRERWALERPTQEESSDGSTGEPGDEEQPLTETLRKTLAGLPPIHRECLVLFYLEGKSIAEAATVLGLSETAFKTRLHRARAALREELEGRLEANLNGLRPSPGLASMVMLAIPLGKPVLSIGGALAAAAAKLSPAAGLASLVQLFATGPAVLMQYWISKKETENLRDRDGIRARNLVRFRNATIGMVVVTMVALAIMNHVFDLKTLCRIFAVLTLGSCLYGMRQLRISRHRNVLATWIGTGILGLAFAGVGFFGWNVGMLSILQGIFFLFMSFMLDAQPLRPDLSLFVAAQSGSLPAPDASAAVRSATRSTADELFAFARFLGARMLAFDWKRGADHLTVRLAPVTPSACLGSLPSFWNDASTLTLFCDGGVETHLGKPDRKSLLALSPNGSTAPGELEMSVGRAASLAMGSFRAGATAAAEHHLGQQPTAAIYRVEPAKTGLARTRKWLLRGVGLLIIAQGIWMFRYMSTAALQAPSAPGMPPRPVQMAPAKPVVVEPVIARPEQQPP